MYLTVERKNRKEYKHKLASVAEGPFNAMKTDTHAMTIVKTYPFVETVSRSRFVPAIYPRTEKKTERRLQPIKLRSDKVSKEANMTDIVTGNDDYEDADAVQCDTGIVSPNQINSGPGTRIMNQK